MLAEGGDLFVPNLVAIYICHGVLRNRYIPLPSWLCSSLWRLISRMRSVKWILNWWWYICASWPEFLSQYRGCISESPCSSWKFPWQPAELFFYKHSFALFSNIIMLGLSLVLKSNRKPSISLAIKNDWNSGVFTKLWNLQKYLLHNDSIPSEEESSCTKAINIYVNLLFQKSNKYSSWSNPVSLKRYYQKMGPPVRFYPLTVLTYFRVRLEVE